MARNITSTLRKVGKAPAPDYEQRQQLNAPRTEREYDDEQTEHDRYRRKQRRMADQDTASSLPIKVVGKEERVTKPKPGTTFEGPVNKLIEKYKDPREVLRHMTTGQFMKYELRGGQIWEGDQLIYDGTEFMKD